MGEAVKRHTEGPAWAHEPSTPDGQWEVRTAKGLICRLVTGKSDALIHARSHELYPLCREILAKADDIDVDADTFAEWFYEKVRPKLRRILGPGL